MDDSVSSTKVSINLSSSETIRNLYFLKERKIFVLTADVENRGYLDTLKEIAEQKKDCGVKVFSLNISDITCPLGFYNSSLTGDSARKRIYCIVSDSCSM